MRAGRLITGQNTKGNRGVIRDGGVVAAGNIGLAFSSSRLTSLLSNLLHVPCPGIGHGIWKAAALFTGYIF